MRGIIKVGKNTAGHQAFLEGKGYTCKREGDNLAVEVTGFVDNVDVSGGIATLQAMVAAKQAATYSTKFLFADGKVLFGVPACTRLGKASALIMKPEKAAKKASVASEFDTL